jgi:hypothetical protein
MQLMHGCIPAEAAHGKKLQECFSANFCTQQRACRNTAMHSFVCIIFLQGEQCFVLEATANIDTSQITNDLGQSLTEWAAANNYNLKSQARATKRMCFYKLLQKKPAANVTYSMCRTGRCKLSALQAKFLSCKQQNHPALSSL